MIWRPLLDMFKFADLYDLKECMKLYCMIWFTYDMILTQDQWIKLPLEYRIIELIGIRKDTNKWILEGVFRPVRLSWWQGFHLLINVEMLIK